HMRIVELTIKEFDEFASSHPLRSYCQSSAYARFMGEQGYSYDYVGFEDNGVIIAASLILYRRIRGLRKYAYAPKGFLIDYYNLDLLKAFIKDITKKYKDKKMVFLKINPEIIIGELKPKKNFASTYNQNVKIIDDLKDLKFKRRREVIPFDLILPKINPYINLKKYDFNKLNKDFKKEIKLSNNRGLEYELASSREINIFYNFIKDKTTNNINSYRNLINIFSKSEMAELILIKVDYRKFLLQAKESYEKELENNNECNAKIQEDPNEENLNIKMESDKLLLQLKNNIIEATEGLKKESDEYIAGAIIIKFLNRVTIVASGYDKKFESLNPKHFLYNKLFEIYKEEYDYIDLNGLADDFSLDSQFYEENQFKLGFNPDIYEFIGEFDIILDDFAFRKLQSKDLITKEFKNYKGI
ncbi:MAG: peptidoglycan bridge formation glycyltransferase FemA/FemB family protein, partial [Bacilli bacterium]|nr:peptidoglycan bridge formation glycyltransferase FemA/FemB family protein [Bacilli bacterium]